MIVTSDRVPSPRASRWGVYNTASGESVDLIASYAAGEIAI